MKRRILSAALSVALLVAVAAGASGCNTLRGVGKDIETGGVAIQDAVNR